MTFKPELAQQLVAQTYPLIWGPTAGKQVTHLHHKAVATVLRELAYQGMAKKPADVLDMANYLEQTANGANAA